MGSIEPLVEGLADPKHIEFEGNVTFSALALHDSLIRHGRFVMAALPAAPLQPFLNTLRDEVLCGYQRNGFPEARVNVSLESGRERVHVKIEEGPRVQCGGVKVTGVEKSLGRLMASCLTNAPSAEDSDEYLHWHPGEPAYFDAHACPLMEKVLRDCLANRGWFFPNLAVRVERQPGAASAELLVAVSSLGPPGTVEELAIKGNKMNAARDILSLLDLKRGAKITRTGMTAAEAKLRGSGRFLEAHLEPEPLPVTNTLAKGVRLVITVREYEAVPKLAEPLSATQKALLRLGSWLSQLASCPQDVVVSFTCNPDKARTGFAGELILSSSEGMLLTLRSQGTAREDNGYTFVLRRNTAGIYPTGQMSKLVNDRAGLSLSPYAVVSIQPAPPGANTQFNFIFWFGWTFENDENATKQAAHLPVLRLDLLPAGFLALGSGTNLCGEIKGGYLTLTNSHSWLKADARNGQLTAYIYNDSVMSLRLRPQAGAFAEATRLLEAGTATHTNVFDHNHPVASVVAFAARELTRSCFSARLATNSVSAKIDPRVVEALDHLLSAQVFEPLDKVGDETSAGAFFWVPKEEDRRLEQQTGCNLWFPMVLEHYAGGWFPRNSWPSRVLLDAALLFGNARTNGDNDLKDLCRSSDIGPIGCWVAGYVASQFSLDVYRELAAKGLFADGAFPIDYLLLLQGDSGVALSFSRFAVALRELPAADVDALAGGLPTAEGLLIKQAYRALRSAPDEPLASTLAPLLNEYWRTNLGPLFHAGFECSVSHP